MSEDTEQPSKREQIEQLMAELRADQATTIADATAYFAGEEIAAIEAKLDELKKGVVPGEVLDKSLDNVMNAIRVARRALVSPVIQALAAPAAPPPPPLEGAEA